MKKFASFVSRIEGLSSEVNFKNVEEILHILAAIRAVQEFTSVEALDLVTGVNEYGKKVEQYTKRLDKYLIDKPSFAIEDAVNYAIGRPVKKKKKVKK